MDFNFVIPVAVRYNLESVAILYSIPESPYAHFKHDDFWLHLLSIFAITFI